MCCTDEPGHPRYQDGDAADQDFATGELLYRRYLLGHFQNNQLLPAAFTFPRPSFNREKYSGPEDVLHADCCGGTRRGEMGVLECSSTDLPAPIDGADGGPIRFRPVHRPLKCCYAHTEIWCRNAEGEDVERPSRHVREAFRVGLALRMTVRILARG
jgi:hypothetical protein